MWQLFGIGWVRVRLHIGQQLVEIANILADVS